MTNKKFTNEEVIEILKQAIDVINYQKIKITVLKDYSEDLVRKLTSSTIISNVTENQRIKREKAEAYKEFAEQLKKKYYDNPDVDFDDFVDNLFQEMVGEKNDI